MLRLLAVQEEAQAAAERPAAEEAAAADGEEEGWGPVRARLVDHWDGRRRLSALLSRLARKPLPYDEADLCRLLTALAELYTWDELPVRGLARTIARRIGEVGLTPAVRAGLEAAVAAPEHHPAVMADARHALAQLMDVLREGEAEVEIDADDDWGVAARAALLAVPLDERAAWLAVLAHAQTATASKPAATWRKAAQQRVAAMGEGRFIARVTDWLGLLHRPASNRTRQEPGGWMPIPTALFTDRNSTLLRGLLWCCADFEEEALARTVAEATEACFKKIPEIGARCTKGGNAGRWALGAMPGPHGAAQLVRLQRLLKQPSARGRLDKTMDATAARAGMTRDDLEDRAVPTHDLQDGRWQTAVGPYTAAVVVRGPRQVDVQWLGANGAALAEEPADARTADAAAHQRVAQVADEVRKTLLAQRDRLERLLLADRDWALGDWRGLYLDHPLLGALARPLVWAFAEGERTALGAWRDGRLVDALNRPLDWLTDATRVRLWHPITSPADTVLAWREWLERHGITQPFKQAHREVYLVTEAERAAGTGSRRFAEHVLRQHQFRALCQQRGWRYGLQGSFDSADSATPTLELPRWGLHAELDVEPIEEEDMMSANAIFLYVLTDELRFVRPAPPGPNSPPRTRAEVRSRIMAALRQGGLGSLTLESVYPAAAVLDEPVPLADVPPVVFSEVMRDVDLFVSAASVGADPRWLETAPARYADYWSHFSFGELAPSAQSRRAVLERLLPRLRIAARCTLTDRFLVVRGDLRTYKIHLGSGNVQMEPNSQYLCIVPRRGADLPGEPGHLYLPFDEDSVLSVILSKAFLLADDRAIKDPTITRQIQPD
jgi:hypothetical protein